MKNKIITFVIFVVISIFAVSCSMTPAKQSVKMNFEMPEEILRSDDSAESFKISLENVSKTKWWKSFEDSVLTNFIDKVISKNLDVKLAISRVKMLESQFDLSKSRMYPAVNLSGNYTNAEGPQSALNMTPEGPSMVKEIQTYENYSLRTGLQYELDIWGKVRSMKNSAVAELMSSKADLETVYLNIIANATALYYNILSTKKQIYLTEKTLLIYKHNKKVMQKRFRNGLVSKLNLDLIDQATAMTLSKLEGEKSSYYQLMMQLSVLLGEYPKFLENSNLEIALQSTSNLENSISTFDFPPLTISSDLLKTRPDVIAAEFKLDSSREQLGVAKADLFPSISITAGLSLVSGSIDDLFSSDFMTKTIGAEVNYPIFTGGSKLANLDMKKVLYEQAVINYKKVVLNAFLDVEKILVQQQFLEKQKEALTRQFIAAQNARDEYEKRYLKGLVSYDKFLEAEKSLYNSKTGIINIELALINSKIQLHRALGGNWMNYE